MVRTNRGFTLTETLLVISIVAFLSALVFALTAPVRERARQAQCINNLKQIGLAIQVYRQDWDGMDPIEGGLPLPYHRLGLPDGLWRDALNLPRSVWFCPSRWCDPHYTAAHERHASSYMFVAMSERSVDMINQDSDTFVPYRRTGEILSEDPNFPILLCVHHDRSRHVVGPDRMKFYSEGRVIGLSLFGNVQWYDYAYVQRKRHQQ